MTKLLLNTNFHISELKPTYVTINSNGAHKIMSETPATYSTDTKGGTKIRKLTPRAKLDYDFTYHAPSADQVDRYRSIRNQAKALAQTILECCPPSSKRDTALSFVTVASMMANASIATTEADA